MVKWKPDKIVSGGQTGVDRAGLDAAFDAGITSGGYCPKGRRAEDGVIPERYPLIETEEKNYKIRTERNVIESDGTLILNQGSLTGGTLLTLQYARKHQKPVCVIQLENTDISAVHQWGSQYGVKILNIAGPRESKFPDGIYESAMKFLQSLFVEDRS
jgi:hypothetical protein